MKLVSPFLKRVVYPSMSAAGLFRGSAGRGLAVVTYHGVVPAGYEAVDLGFDGNLITAEAMRRQLRMLKARYRVVSPDDVLAWRESGRELPPRAVLLTCDDGLLNNLTDMLPVLEQEQVKCLFFVTAAASGGERSMLWYEELFLLLLRAPEGTFEIAHGDSAISVELGAREVSMSESRRAMWWSAVKRLSQIDAASRNLVLGEMQRRLSSDSWRGFDCENLVSCRRFGLMTAVELRTLASAGMTIGAHTLSHPVLSQMPLDLARAEIGESRERLESVLQARVWAFAYPFGDAQSVTPEVLALPEQADYAAAFLNYGGGLGAELLPYALPRIHVTSEMSVAELEAHVSGFYGRLRRLISA